MREYMDYISFINVSFDRIVTMLFSVAAENDPHDGKRKCEALWPIFHISHQKSQYKYI
jgi:hypothetical protein